MASMFVIGWDVGGAHVKASLCRDGALADIVQWPCPLWRGLEHLDAVLADARRRWPELPHAHHAMTMTGEMADGFATREAGVRALAQRIAALPGAGCRLWAAPGQWCGPGDVAERWRDIASANWLATAALAARAVGDGVLVDIGSTTTDLVALRSGRPAPRGWSDAARLESGELVYHGVVRTPLCAVAQRIEFRGTPRRVMNEWFATSADVYRSTGELDPEHDQQPTADGAGKDPQATLQRLARMIGMEAADAQPGEWRAFAAAWREQQLDAIGDALRDVAAAVPASAPLVAAGCGDFLAAELARRSARPVVGYAAAAGVSAALARRASLCAPSVALALLRSREER